MEGPNPTQDADILSTGELGDEGAADIVSRTGEEMPLATHDQGCGYVHPLKPGKALVPADLAPKPIQ